MEIKGKLILIGKLKFKKIVESEAWKKFQPFNPLSPTSDPDRISPYTISTISSRQVMRIKKNIN